MSLYVYDRVFGLENHFKLKKYINAISSGLISKRHSHPSLTYCIICADALQYEFCARRYKLIDETYTFHTLHTLSII